MEKSCYKQLESYFRQTKTLLKLLNTDIYVISLLSVYYGNIQNKSNKQTAISGINMSLYTHYR